MAHNKQKHKIILRLFVSVGIIMSVVLTTLLSISASAEDIALSDSFLQKLMVNAMRDCYSGGFISKTINSNSFSNGNYKVSGIFSAMADIDMVAVPEGFTNSNVTGSAISCKEVFNGAGGINGLLALYKANPTLADLGFISQATTTGMNEGCVWGEYGKVESGSSTPTYYETDKICVTFEGDNGVVTTENASLSASPKPGDVILYMGSGGPCASDHFCYDIKDISHITKQPIPIDFWGGTWEDLVDSFNAELSSVIDGVGQSKGLSYAGTKTEVTNGGEGGSTTKTQVNNAASIFLGRLTNYETGFVDDAYWNQFKFSDTDLYYLYDAYFHQYLGKGLAINYDRCYDTKEEVPTEHRHKVGEKWCEVMINPNEFPGSTKVNVVNDSRTGVDNKVTLNRIIEILDDSTINPFDDDDSYIPGTDPEIPSGSGEEENVVPENRCADGASSLGWILCPVLTFAANTADQLYLTIAEQWLDIPAENLATGSQIHENWKKIRDMANIGFIILILIVVLSQVTGIGLNNYSIKKMLPTIIVMAVLVNLSFIICQLAVDISNITGNAIYELFDGMAAAVGQSEFEFSNLVKGLAMTLLAGGGFVLTFGLMSNNVGVWLIPFLLVLISSIFSTIFFFIVLAVRQAGVYILVILSPLAIVCYSLPNLKKYYDRWLKLFSSLLMVYPVCGALMGGGKFASFLLLTGNDGITFALVGLLLQVLPFFLIPSLVRGSLAVAGNIGTKIAGFGQKLGSMAGKGIAGTEIAKDVQRRATMHDYERKATALKNGRGIRNRLARGLNRIGLTGMAEGVQNSNNRSVARFSEAYNKMQKENIAADMQSRTSLMRSGSAELENYIATEQRRLEAQQAENAANYYRNNFDTNDISAMGTELMSALSSYDSNPDDPNSMANVRALQDLLLSRGPKGQGEWENVLMDYATAHGTTAATQMAANYITNDDKKLGMVKGNSPIGGTLAQDLARGKFSGRSDILQRGADKMSAAGAAKAGENLYNSILSGVANGDFNGANGAKALAGYANSIRQAFSDERIANTIKDEDAALMNKVLEADYNRRAADWMTANPGTSMADYKAQFGQFTPMSSGEKPMQREIEVPREFKKFDSTATGISPTVTALGLKDGQYYFDDGTNVRKLNKDERKELKRIREINVDVRINNRRNQRNNTP